MSVAELQKYTAVSKYSRYVEEMGRRETWEETADRYADMLVQKYPHRAVRIDRLRKEFIKPMRVLPSMRGMQFGGPPVFKHNARLYNCWGSYVDRLSFFGEAFYILLCGGGVGASVQECHLRSLPCLSKARLSGRSLPTKTYKPEDSIEGWANCGHVLMTSYHERPVPGFEEWLDCDVKFDLSGIRKKNSPLSYGVGRAPGPMPLAKAMYRNRELLNKALSEGLVRLTDELASDIHLNNSDAVVSGGVRRSANIIIFDLWSRLMRAYKTGNWMEANPQRARANISSMLVRGKVNWDAFWELFGSTKEFGEPGFWWADHEDYVTNPCFRGNTRLATSEGLVRVDELYRRGTANSVVGDYRVGAGDDVRPDACPGVTVRSATPVILTQKDANIYRLTTEHGYTVETTDNHEFPTLQGRRKLKELRPGDILLLQSGEGRFGNSGTYNQGLLLGLMTGDGCVCNGAAWLDLWEDDFGDCESIRDAVNQELQSVPSIGKRPGGDINWTAQHGGNQQKRRIGGERLFRFFRDVVGLQEPADAKKGVPECVWHGSREFVRGYLHGLFHADGSVQCQDRGSKTSLNLRLTQANRQLLADVQQLLQNFGVVSRLYGGRHPAGKRLLPDGKGGVALYECQEIHELVVNRPNLASLMRAIGLFGRKDVLARTYLDVMGWNSRKPERFQTKVVSVEWVAKEDVYCLTEPETNTVIANGVVTGQCAEIMFYCRLLLGRDDPALASLLAKYDGPLVDVDGKVGLSGWQACNLTTQNGRTVKTEFDLYELADAAAELGTYQAGFTDFPYLGPVTEGIIRKEALLGVSIAGVMHNPDVMLSPGVLGAAASRVVTRNNETAGAIGINPAARLTCIKPDGNSSSTLGSFSGCHPGKIRKGFRIAQANKQERPYQHFKSVNPRACEPSAWSKSGSDDVIRFPVQYEGLLEDDMAAVEFLGHVRTLQKHWVGSGTVSERCVRPGLHHNVSCTVKVRENEWDGVARTIYDHQNEYGGVSFISEYGDRDYVQAPFTPVFDTDELVKMYGQSGFAAGLLIADRFLDVPSTVLWSHADVALGLRSEYPEAVDTMAAIKYAAETFFEGDVRQAVYAVKDAYNHLLHEELRDTFRPVDYSQMTGENDVDFQGEVACAGGACET
jgi:ribonucleotide reductase class II